MVPYQSISRIIERESHIVTNEIKENWYMVSIAVKFVESHTTNYNDGTMFVARILRKDVKDWLDKNISEWYWELKAREFPVIYIRDKSEAAMFKLTWKRS